MASATVGRWLVAVQRPVQWQPDVMHSSAVSAPPATTHHHTQHQHTQPHISYIKKCFTDKLVAIMSNFIIASRKLQDENI